MIKREPKASQRIKKRDHRKLKQNESEALNNAKNKVISQLKKLPVDEQIDFLNEKQIGWLTKRKENKYNRNEYIYPDNVQDDYYHDLQASGNLPHIELSREATNNRFAKSIIFKYIEQNKDLLELEQCWEKTNSTMWGPPSFIISLIIEEVYTKQRDMKTLPIRLAKLIKSHWGDLDEVNYRWRLKYYLGNNWPQLKSRFTLGESAQELDTEIAQYVHPATDNGVSPGQINTVARNRASFGLRYKQKVNINR